MRLLIGSSDQCKSVFSLFSIVAVRYVSRPLAAKAGRRSGPNDESYSRSHQRDARMSLINTEIKPFKATAFQNGKFVDVTEARPEGQVVGRLLLPGRLHLRLPDRARRPGRPLRRVPEARRRDLRRLDRHALRAQGLARHLDGDRQDRVPDGRRPDATRSAATSTC